MKGRPTRVWHSSIMSPEVLMAARCEKFKGEGAEQCKALKASYTSLCPTEWVEKWDDLREAGNFPGRILFLASNMWSYHQGYQVANNATAFSVISFTVCCKYVHIKICMHICTLRPAWWSMNILDQNPHCWRCVVTLVALTECTGINIIQVQRFCNFVVMGLSSIVGSCMRGGLSRTILTHFLAGPL